MEYTKQPAKLVLYSIERMFLADFADVRRCNNKKTISGDQRDLVRYDAHNNQWVKVPPRQFAVHREVRDGLFSVMKYSQAVL